MSMHINTLSQSKSLNMFIYIFVSSLSTVVNIHKNWLSLTINVIIMVIMQGVVIVYLYQVHSI